MEANNDKNNDMAVRDALNAAIILLKACEWPDDAPVQDIAELIGKIEKVSSEPPRNCEVGTPDEQSARFDAHCRKHMGCLTCPLREKDGSVPKHCEFAWGAMPCTEGGEK